MACASPTRTLSIENAAIQVELEVSFYASTALQTNLEKWHVFPVLFNCHLVCADGVKKNTNVIELYNLIFKGAEDNQRTWYNSGIGTYAKPSWKSLKFYWQVLSHKVDLAIAWFVYCLLKNGTSSHLILTYSGILNEQS